MRLRAREIKVGDVIMDDVESLPVVKVSHEVSSAKSKRPMLKFLVEGSNPIYTRPDTFFEVQRKVTTTGTRRNAGGTYFTPQHDGLDSIREMLL